MPRHPKLQLVVVGPIGDATGAAAVCKLGKLQQNFSSRMYCPVDHYVAGEEKSLILKATDYCLVPSRCVVGCFNLLSGLAQEQQKSKSC